MAGGGAGVENQNLAFFDFLDGGVGDAKFFLMVEFFFFAERGIFESAIARGERAAVRAVNEAVGVKDFEILANRDLRGVELACEFGD